MDCLKATQAYVDKIITNTPGIKVLLLDAETVRFVLPPAHPKLTPHQTAILSLASTQSSLLSQEVYLTDRINNPSRSLPSNSHPHAHSSSAYPPSSSRPVERQPHLKCICLLRPTEESIEACERELKEGRYGGYWLCASWWG